jgi:septum formation protein
LQRETHVFCTTKINDMLNLPYQIILGSKSPRRQQLLETLGLPFTTRVLEVDESYSDDLQAQEIPLFLADLKANAYLPTLGANELLITADTVVWIHGKALNKPANKVEALEMLRSLNGATHEVFTGVGITTTNRSIRFYDRTAVTFSQLTEEELHFYIDRYHPFDKAGSYGAQDWIGLVGIESLEGSYFNVMGLPVHKLYQHLKQI